jgi:ElaB/YqjD/DUF883 family membrane-anchored ribosome-binding protein
MAHNTHELLDDRQDIGVAVHLNRVACLWFSDEPTEMEVPYVDRWRATRGFSPDMRMDVFCLPRLQRRGSSVTEVAYYDPAATALAVLVGSSKEARFHSYWTQHLTRRLDALEREFEERIETLVNERVEAAISERDQARRRANDLLNNVVARLREKRQTVQRPPVEESWKMVDFSTLGEEED